MVVLPLGPVVTNWVVGAGGRAVLVPGGVRNLAARGGQGRQGRWLHPVRSGSAAGTGGSWRPRGGTPVAPPPRPCSARRDPWYTSRHEKCPTPRGQGVG